MKFKPVRQRQLAVEDVQDAIDYYVKVDALPAALGLIDALEAAYVHLAEHPATGSPRYAHELNIPELRSWPLTRFPFLIFYVELPDAVDVWRVLHMKRDIPAWMLDEKENSN